MVSDNRWVATTKGIVVFLLTALLFVFWYDRDRELAESHVTAVRFHPDYIGFPRQSS